MARKTGRPRAGQERLSRERIVAAALWLIDDHGMAALSMRRLAGELAVDPMAIYHHLPGKDAVLAAVADAVFAQFRVSADPDAPWQERVRAVARAYREVVRSHPNLVRHLVAHAEVAAPVALEANEALYAALAGAGLTPAVIVRAADLLVDYANGFALAEASGPLGQAADRAEMLTVLEEQPPDRFPVTRQVLGALGADDLGASFDFGLDIILTGLEAVSQHHAINSAARSRSDLVSDRERMACP